MKTINSILLPALFLLISVMACTSVEKSEGRQITRELKNYVDSVSILQVEYSQENWAEIEQGYNQRLAKADEVYNVLDESDKSELSDIKQEYAELKEKYAQELAKRSTPPDYKIVLRNSLFGEGVIGDDMSFSFVNVSNIRSTYQSFVDAVELNRENYSREDWDEIKLLYEALDTRKNEVEKDLSGEDNRAIAALKVKMATLYKVNRPLSKSQENSDAKV